MHYYIIIIDVMCILFNIQNLNSHCHQLYNHK